MRRASRRSIACSRVARVSGRCGRASSACSKDRHGLAIGRARRWRVARPAASRAWPGHASPPRCSAAPAVRAASPRVSGNVLCQHLGNALVVLLPRAPEQRLIGRVLDEGMLERVGGLRRQAPLVEQLGLHQLRQAPLQRQLVQGRHGLQQLIGKRPPQDGPQLRHVFRPRRADPAAPSGSPAAWRESPAGAAGRSAHSGPRCFLEPARLQHRLGQLFHKQRHAIGLGHDLLQHRRGQRLAARDLLAPSPRPAGASAGVRVSWVRSERGPTAGETPGDTSAGSAGAPWAPGPGAG